MSLLEAPLRLQPFTCVALRRGLVVGIASLGGRRTGISGKATWLWAIASFSGLVSESSCSRWQDSQRCALSAVDIFTAQPVDIFSFSWSLVDGQRPVRRVLWIFCQAYTPENETERLIMERCQGTNRIYSI